MVCEDFLLVKNAHVFKLLHRFIPVHYFIIYCPNKDAAMGIILVSLPCTAHLCGSLIVLQVKSSDKAWRAPSQSDGFRFTGLIEEGK